MALWRCTVLALALAWPGTALAQDDEFADDEEAAADELDDEELDEGDEEAGDDADDFGDEGDPELGEDPPDAGGTDPWAFGPYFRFVWVPSFMLEIFTDEAPTVSNAGYGLAATYRPADSSMLFEMGIGFQGYSFEDAFRATGDPEQDTEWLESDLGMIHLTGSMLWRADLVEDTLGLEYGIGLDFGIVTGTLVRSEAAFSRSDNAWEKCDAPNVPNFATLPGVPYCEPNLSSLGQPVAGSAAYDEMGAHYDVEEERVPPVALTPMLPRVGIAYSPIKELVGKLDVAYGIFQFSIGLSIAYVPDL